MELHLNKSGIPHELRLKRPHKALAMAVVIRAMKDAQGKTIGRHTADVESIEPWVGYSGIPHELVKRALQ